MGGHCSCPEVDKYLIQHNHLIFRILRCTNLLYKEGRSRDSAAQNRCWKWSWDFPRRLSISTYSHFIGHLARLGFSRVKKLNPGFSSAKQQLEVSFRITMCCSALLNFYRSKSTSQEARGNIFYTKKSGSIEKCSSAKSVGAAFLLLFFVVSEERRGKQPPPALKVATNQMRRTSWSELGKSGCGLEI